MRKRLRLLAGVGVLAATLAFPAASLAGHLSDPRTPNLLPLGHIEEPRLTGGGPPTYPGTSPDIHTDLGFRGNIAVQGSWLGFNLRNISNPASPSQISYTSCPGNQGDVMIYRNIVVRSWNSAASATPGDQQNPLGRAETNCDGQPVAVGFEGVHVFDITNLADPVLVAQVATPNGSHTATAVPDPANNRLLVYNSASSSATPQIDIISVPLTNPAAAALVRSVPAGGSCHDISVILGDAMMAACSGGPGFRMFSLGGPRGGSLTQPELLYRVDVPTVTVGHSAAFTWNGEIMVFGHEPGGGTQAQCQATDPPTNKSFFFYRSSDGALLGTWVLPRPQGPNENCTLHNFNVVPFLDRHVMVHGSYQAGTGVIDFTNPAAAVEVAHSDPPPEPTPGPGPAFWCTQSTPPGCALGGAWATYWYDGVLYESHISEGLNLWGVDEPWFDSALNLSALNPQTQEETMECSLRVTGSALKARKRGAVRVATEVLDQGVAGLRVRLRGPGVNRTLRTNASGVARATVRPSRAGRLRVSVVGTLNMDGCSKSKRIAKAARPRGGGGAAGAGTGGAGLTGRRI